jgi:putative oxidoreductase
MTLLVMGFAARFGVGLILIVAGVAKLAAGHQTVERLVTAYGLVSGRAASVIARALPLVEVAVGAWLLAGIFAAAAAGAGIVLLAVLTFAVTQALLRKTVVACGCFGLADAARSISWRIVARNASMVAGLALVVVGQR